MLIINNLTEDVSPMPFNRNFSLGGSNHNLAPELAPAPRRNSVIPPYVKNKPKPVSASVSVDKYMTNQKASKSLDSEYRKQTTDLRRQFLHSVPPKRSSVSSEALIEFPKIIETHCSSPVNDTEQFVYKSECSSSQVNLLGNDEVYYGASAPEVNSGSVVGGASGSRATATLTSSLTDLNPRNMGNVITSTDPGVTQYKVTNV